ncbi:MAG: HD domain-containing protein, partial [Desulfobacterales bacterium]
MLFFRKLLPASRQKKYRIEDISTLWLNHEQKGAGEDNLNLKILPDPIEFKHRDTQIFWHQYVVRYFGQIRVVAGLKEAVITVLKELDQNGGCSSIDPDDHETHQKYHCLSDINLRDHSFAVAKKMVDLLEQRKDFNLYAGKAILAGLCHDIGKLHKVTPSAAHSYNSAQWIKHSAGSGLKNIDIVIEAIRMHHRPNKTVLNKNPILHALLEAGHQVRDDELRSMQRPLPKASTDKDRRITEKREPLASETKTPEKEHPVVSDWDSLCFPKKEFIKKLLSKITNFGFDAFKFEENTYVSPKVMEEVLMELKDKTKGDEQLSGSKFVKNKFKLKFHNRKMKPLTRYYFI